MVRSVLAVIAGFFIMVALVTVSNAIITVVFGAAFHDAHGHARMPGIGFYAVDLATSFVFATVGGYCAARIARRAELAHAAALASVIALMSATTMFTARSQLPIWWTLGELVVGVGGVLLGGKLRAREKARIS